MVALVEAKERRLQFLLLQDLVSDDLSSVRFFMRYEGFGASPLPSSVDRYRDYRLRAIAFVQARNRRMTDYLDR